MQPGKDASSTVIFPHLASVKGQGKKTTKKTPQNNYRAQQVTLKPFYFW